MMNNMIKIIVFDNDKIVGAFEVPTPSKDDKYTIYPEVSFEDDTIDILYLRDFRYGVLIKQNNEKGGN